MRLSSRFLVVLVGLLLVSHAQSARAQSTGGESARKVIIKVVPLYPPVARPMALSGTVRIEAVVLANGKAKTVQVKGGNPLLAEAAENAVREWKWAKADHDSTELLEFRFRP
jgi:TonB family protein